VQDTFKKLFTKRFIPQGFLKEEIILDGYRVPVNFFIQILASLSDWHDPSTNLLYRHLILHASKTFTKIFQILYGNQIVLETASARDNCDYE